jgi:hypothetical protein
MAKRATGPPLKSEDRAEQPSFVLGIGPARHLSGRVRLRGTRNVKVLGATAALALMLSVAAASAGKTSGLRGKLLISPGYPLCPADAPCTRPAPQVWLFFAGRGRVVIRTRTSDGGAYRITLAPGTYTVTAPGRSRLRELDPTRVVVLRGHYRPVIFKLDIGIR